MEIKYQTVHVIISINVGKKTVTKCMWDIKHSDLQIQTDIKPTLQ